MTKALVLMILFDVPFLIVSAVLFYFGFIADEQILTDDGLMSRKFFLYLMGGLFLGITLVINAAALRWMLRKRKQIKEMLAYGKRGTAKILKIDDTGVRINDNPRVKLQLEISVPDYPTYFAAKTLEIPLINIPQIQPGLTVNVLADPNDPYNEDRIGLIIE